jgi:hypothetical protein
MQCHLGEKRIVKGDIKTRKSFFIKSFLLYSFTYIFIILNIVISFCVF